MTRLGNIITIEAGEPQSDIATLLHEVEGGKIVRIVRNGKAVAEIRPTHSTPPPFPYFEQLAGRQIDEKAFEPATEDEWPEEYR